MPPDVRYACTADGVNVAYQVYGSGERDLVLVPGWIFHLEVAWEHPGFEAFMRRLARNFRVLLFDKRGTGLSDRVGPSSMEQRMDDVRAVMDAVGSERTSLMGWSEGGNIAALFAATYPDRVDGLVLYAAGARYVRAADYPIGMTDEFIEAGKQVLRDNWGQGIGAYFAAPSRADDESFRRWFGKYERLAVSPGEGLKMLEVNLKIDTTEVLRHLQVPTLVMHNVGDRMVPVEFSRYISDQVPDSKLVELGGDDHLFWFDNPNEILGEIEDFLLGIRLEDEIERVLSTVLFTDIVESTSQASRVGDARWKELLGIHDRVAEDAIAKFRGDVVKHTGDGILATFDGPARAVRCASRLRDELAGSGLTIRAGVHTGEIELREGDIGGVAVHIGARVCAKAGPAEVLTSATVRDLTAGSGLTFVDLGEYELAGLGGAWRLFRADS